MYILKVGCPANNLPLCVVSSWDIVICIVCPLQAPGYFGICTAERQATVSLLLNILDRSNLAVATATSSCCNVGHVECFSIRI